MTKSEKINLQSYILSLKKIMNKPSLESGWLPSNIFFLPNIYIPFLCYFLTKVNETFLVKGFMSPYLQNTALSDYVIFMVKKRPIFLLREKGWKTKSIHCVEALAAALP
jgi:hypothetical protein